MGAGRDPGLRVRAPRKPDFRIVSAKTVIGEGPNRLEIYPLRGETSERQLMVYFPGHQLLYGSDPFQKLDELAVANPGSCRGGQKRYRKQARTPHER